jgi:methylmalonyl-CoA/ethylmalonyl-CoA epimerase
MSIIGLHHVGIVTPDIAVSAPVHVKRFGWEEMSPVVHDPVQTAFVQFFRVPGDTTFLELVAPDGEKSKLARSAARGGLNHVCYGTDNIEDACTALRGDGMILLQAPVDAHAFPGRRIAWLMGRDGIPVELVEWFDRGRL